MGVTYVSVKVETTITLTTMLHIGTGLGLGQILDDTIVQGPHPHAGHITLPYIPGSSLKGRLRSHVRQLTAFLGWQPEQRSTAEAHLFGFDNRPGGLVFVDAHIQEFLAQSLRNEKMPDSAALRALLVRSQRSFVSLSRQRRVALEQRLFRIEMAEPEIPFTFQATGRLPESDSECDLGLLLAAMCDLTHLGGHKARGCGQCRVSIDEVYLNNEPVTDWQRLVKYLP
jgi:CRISPR/Cas system CSM-associated protein Csm3 (group 7 of RAMP superfamily)